MLADLDQLVFVSTGTYGHKPEPAGLWVLPRSGLEQAAKAAPLIQLKLEEMP